MAVLITGAGLLGSQVAAKFVERGEPPILYDVNYNLKALSAIVDIDRVKTIVGDLLDLPFLIDTINRENIDRIIHTAALLYPGVVARPYTGVKVNILGTLNVLEAAKLTGVRRVVFTSSGMVYSSIAKEAADAPYQEDFTMKCISHMPMGIYGITKLTAEYLGLSYYKFYGVDFVALRPSGLFGPWPGTPSGVPPQFIDTFVKNAALGKPIIIDDPLFTYTGVQNFVYSKDVAKACLLACFADGLKLRVYNISGDRPYTFQEIIDITKRAFPQVEIRVKEISKAGWFNGPVERFPYVTSEAQNELGYQPDYDLEASFRDYGEWLRQHGQT